MTLPAFRALPPIKGGPGLAHARRAAHLRTETGDKQHVTQPSPNIVASATASKPPPVRKGLQLAKMLAYFMLLLVGVRILQEIFKEIAGTGYFAELSRLSGLAASTLDAAKNLDDVIVTLFALMITFLLILPVAWVHILTKGDETDASLTQTLIMLSVIVAGVMLLLEDNLARSFSLVGVVAAVRYRNTLKDPKDAVFVFLSLGAIAEKCTERSPSPSRLEAYAEATSQMLIAFVRGL